MSTESRETMSRWLALFVVVAVFVLSLWMSGGSIGASMACDGSSCVVTAASSFGSALFSIGLIFLLLFWPRNTTQGNSDLGAGVWRRFGAFVLDFSVIFLAFLPLMVIPFLLAEASYAGTFHWAFQRSFTRPTDSDYVMSSMFALFILMFCYFYLHLKAGRPTIGQYVLGYRITSVDSVEYGGGADRRPLYALRVITSFLGFCVWPISVILALISPNKSFWWDSASNTKAVRLSRL